MRFCAVMQPTYLPWLGYFDLMRNVEVFVIYDNVQFEKQSWQQRNRIRNKDGEIMLTIPVQHGQGLHKSIKEVRIDYSRSSLDKHLMTIKHSYSRSKNFETIFSTLVPIYSRKPVYLIDLNMELIQMGISFFNIRTDVVFSSALEVQGAQVEALIDICQKVNANKYLSPLGSKVYIDKNNLFCDFNISLEYQNFEVPVYAQGENKDFISHLSFIDYLFHVDLTEASNFGKKK